MRFAVLGSGSTGNTSLVAIEEHGRRRVVLVDCGLGPRILADRLAPFGLDLDDIAAVILTHLDHDHCAPAWPRQLRNRGIRAHLHFRHRARALRMGFDGRTMELFDEPFTIDGSLAVEPVMLAHDDLGSVGFVLAHDGCRLGYATDLGATTTALRDRFVDLHALAIESNYDVRMQRASDRPDFLKRRIMSGRGHLSNDEALRVVETVARRSALAHLVLLHLSRECNEPEIVRRLYADRAPHLLDRLTISDAREPTPLLPIDATAAGGMATGVGGGGEQLRMF